MRFEVKVCRKDSCSYQFFTQNGNKVHQILWLTTTDVINCIRRNGETIFTISFFRCTLHYTDNAFDNIINIGKVAFTVTIVKNLNGFTFKQFISKAKISHIRSSCWSVNRKEP